MTTISIERKDLQPYETVTGTVSWDLDDQPRDLELRLCWFSRDDGMQESKTIRSLKLDDVTRGERTFSFELPSEPWSMRGQLITLVWGIELVAKAVGGLALEEFIVGPDRKVVELPELPEATLDSRLRRFKKRLDQQRR